MNGMKALVYHGAMDVRVDDKPKPKIEDPEDIVLKVTKAAICGSDLHLFHGNFKSMEPGQTLGHEFAGVVEQTGDRVTEVKEGDRVVNHLIFTAEDAGFVEMTSGPSVAEQTQ